MYRWTPETVQYMKDASEYAGYHRELAGQIVPYLTKESSVCDAGCGLGYLAVELAPFAGQVTAVDISAEALRVLEEKKIPNVTVRCGDITALLPEKPYDAMVFCFFGSMEEVLAVAAKQCRGDVFVITRNYEEHRFSRGRIPKSREHGLSRFREVLEERGVSFEERTLELEFGQPFRSREDAWRFFERYSRDGVSEAVLQERLVAGRGEFPWYLPQRRKLGWLRFSAADIGEM